MVKSYAFALKIITLFQKLQTEKKEYILSKQLLRSGTSIGANVEEANGAYSKAEFTSKMSIAYKEARETHYWLRLFRDSEILTETECALYSMIVKSYRKLSAALLKRQDYNEECRIWNVE